MKISLINFAILLTFIGLFIFVWIPTAESKGGGTGYKGSKQPECGRICTWRKQQEKASSSNSGSSWGGTGSSGSGSSSGGTGSSNDSPGNIF